MGKDEQRELEDLYAQAREVRTLLASPGWATVLKQMQTEQAKCEADALVAGTEWLFTRATLTAAAIKGASTVGERVLRALEGQIAIMKQNEMV